MTPESSDGLQVSVEEVAAWSRRLVITVPARRVRSERARVARDLSRRVKVPGFRKGKIPPQRLEARFGEDIDRETRQQLVQEAFREAVEQTGLEPINQPRIANISYDAESDLTFEVAFDIWPDISLDRLGGFRVQQPEVEVGEDEVQERLEQIRRQNAVWQTVDRRPVAGDSVSVEITLLQDEEGAEEGEARSHRFVLGRGQAIPDVEDAITTLAPGESGEFNVTFPEDAADESKQGQSQRMRISVKEVHEPELPELDDEFARTIGDFEGIEELEAAIREDELRQKQDEAEFHVEHQLIDQIIEANPFEVPESWVEQEAERYLRAMVEDPEQVDPQELDRLRQEARKPALRGIKRMLIVRKVAQEQDLKVTKEEIEDRVRAIASRADRSVQEVRARLADSGELERLAERITERKVLEHLKERSGIGTSKDEQPSVEEGSREE